MVSITAFSFILMANHAQAQGPFSTYDGHESTNGAGLRFENMSKASIIGLLVAPFIGLAMFCLAYALQSYRDDEFEAKSSQSSKRDQADMKGPSIVFIVGNGYELLRDGSEPC